MRNCPRCLKTAVIEDGYCGHCRECTLPPLEEIIPLRVTAAILDERKYQESKWPGHRHSTGEWLLIMRKCLDDAQRAWVYGHGDDSAALHEIRQVVAVGVAAMTQCGSPCRTVPNGLTGRCFSTGFVEPVLDLANLTARKPGRGTFTSLIEHFRKDYPKVTLYVENVLEPRFQRKLVRLGFTEVPSEWSFLPKSYVLLAVQR